MFNNFYFLENRAVHEITWKNIVQLDRPQMTIRRMRIACWIPNATKALSGYVILFAFPQQQQLRERPQYYVMRTLSVLLDNDTVFSTFTLSSS